MSAKKPKTKVKDLQTKANPKGGDVVSPGLKNQKITRMAKTIVD